MVGPTLRNQKVNNYVRATFLCQTYSRKRLLLRSYAIPIRRAVYRQEVPTGLATQMLTFITIVAPTELRDSDSARGL
jgi:hypothetical protein